MTTEDQHVVDFYTRHPISAEHILMRVEQDRGHLDGVTAADLFPYDQDHYGGLAANAALATRADLQSGFKIADFCAGLGGPARWWATQYDVDVTGIELNPDRASGAQRLTQVVGLQDSVRVVQGNVLTPPVDDNAMDAVLSQEAFLHIPDKREALRQAYRILRPGGRLAFTDWVMHQPLSADEAQDMWQGIAAQTLQNPEGYRGMIAEVGFEAVSMDDLTADWGDILAERLEMYRKLRTQTAQAGTPSGDDAFFDSYVRLVDHVRQRKLGGARFSAVKPG